ncbi:MAG: DUF547 domain-containing protein [Terrimicrobiaceae bacterium]
MITRFFAAFAFLVFAAGASWQPLHGAELPEATGAAPPAYGDLLQKYATPNGIRYAAWHANPDDLQLLKTVTDFYATTSPPEDREAALAWHLNAYNAGILAEILKKYPTKGPLDGEPHFFEKDRIVVSGKLMSFNHLEQKLIRPAFNEPRIHFALNCASESCPPLFPKPFTVDSLEADLERLTRAFIDDNPQGVDSSGRRPKISKLFDWYAGDFGGKKNLLVYVNRYRRTPIPVAEPFDFLEYSWKLNSAP